VAALLSAWWYARNLWNTHSLTGVGETITLPGTTAMLAAADGLPWRPAVQSTLVSHLYFGGWSSLAAPRWTYYALVLIAAVAALGLLPLWRKTSIRSLVYIYGLFWVAQLYHVMLIYTTKSVATSMGWYLYAVIGAQAVLTVAGLSRLFGGASIWIGALAFGALDLYTMHRIALPYYGGMARWSGRSTELAGFDARELLSRLTAFKPPFVTEPVLAALWALYLAATIVLLVLAFRLGRLKRA
jgi:hypothetical protein